MLFLFFIFGFLFCSLSLPAVAAAPYRGVSPAILAENNPKFLEIYRIQILNRVGGSIEVSENQGKFWKTIGRVIYPATAVNDRGYTASKWVEDGVVAATAVNAIHLKTGFNLKDNRGVIFSIFPQIADKLPITKSVIYTDILPGDFIFGGDFSPLVGNKVFVFRSGQKGFSLTATYAPQIGDRILIKVEIPKRYPKEIIFENRFGGEISIEYFDGEKKVIGEVLRPVLGVGRFEGTKYASAGRIRANHAGVIDISTSSLGSVGGFQIIPAMHSMSEEMERARKLTAWMIVGPTKGSDPSLEGMAPLFKYFIKPVYGIDDLENEEWEERLIRRFLVQVKVEGSNSWQPLSLYEFDDYYLTEDLPPWANDALSNITHFRIFFPLRCGALFFWYYSGIL